MGDGERPDGEDVHAKARAMLLSGIDTVAVQVSVHPNSVKLEDVRLDAAALREYAASRVRRVGLAAVTEEEANHDTPILMVRLSLFAPADTQIVVFRVDTHLFEHIAHPRLLGTRMMLPTWTNENQGIVGVGLVTGAVVGFMSDMVDAFAGNWAEARRGAQPQEG